MIEYIISFFRPNLLFQMYPSPLEGRGLQILLFIFSLFFLLGLSLIYIIQSRHCDIIVNKGLKKIRTFFFIMSIVGYIYTFFAYEGAPFLSARIWFLMWFIITLVWLFFCLQYFKRELPKFREYLEKKRIHEKYLPR